NSSSSNNPTVRNRRDGHGAATRGEGQGAVQHKVRPARSRGAVLPRHDVQGPPRGRGAQRGGGRRAGGVELRDGRLRLRPRDVRLQLLRPGWRAGLRGALRRLPRVAPRAGHAAAGARRLSRKTRRRRA
ncbi:unnamed protein product, partial [Prorocentrum cordatum]